MTQKRARYTPSGVKPKGQPNATNLYEHFIPVISERKVYIRKGVGLKVLRVAGAFMSVNLPAKPHNYQEIFLEPEQFDALRKTIRTTRRRQ